MANGFWMMSIGLAIAKTVDASRATTVDASIAPTVNALTAVAMGLAGVGFSLRVHAYFVMDLDHAFFAVARALAIRATDSVVAEAAPPAICRVGLACIESFQPKLKKRHNQAIHPSRGSAADLNHRFWAATA